MKRWTKAIAGGLILCLLLQVLGFAGSSAGIRERVIRLHVLAHDDSDDEQALKLKVRDAVSETASALVGGVPDRADALCRLRAGLPQLEAAGHACVREAGYAHAVRAELTEMYFTARAYDEGTYPAGVYDALRITIGDGAGRNWWCGLYPPLCVAAAMKSPTAEDVLTKNQRRGVSTPRYAVRFKVVEWGESLFR